MQYSNTEVDKSQEVRRLQAPVKPGRLYVLSGPSGVGKDAILERLRTRLPGLEKSVSATTRPTRPGETEGADYFFVSRAHFEADVAEGMFLEHAEYGENLYGTPRRHVEEALASGQDVVLKIEVQGAAQIRMLFPDAVLIFVQPPSMEELERRLTGRASDTPKRIGERLAIARRECEHIPEYDYLVTNAVLAEAVRVVEAIIVAERHRVGK